MQRQPVYLRVALHKKLQGEKDTSRKQQFLVAAHFYNKFTYKQDSEDSVMNAQSTASTVDPITTSSTELPELTESAAAQSPLDSKNTLPYNHSASQIPKTCRLDAPASPPEVVELEVDEIETLVQQFINPDILGFDCLPAGESRISDEGHQYNAWFTVLATGEIFPVNFTDNCEETPLDIWVDPDWFSGTLYVILGVHRIQFIERLEKWMDLQWQIKAGKVV